jgi:hypothetical protein
VSKLAIKLNPQSIIVIQGLFDSSEASSSPHSRVSHGRLSLGVKETHAFFFFFKKKKSDRIIEWINKNILGL